MNLPPLTNGPHFLSSYYDLQNDAIGLFLNAHKGNGSVVRLRFGPHQPYYFSDPEHIKHIFQTHAANYQKKTRGYARIRMLFGDGLITSNGWLWQEQRNLAQPEFRKQKVDEMFGPMKSCVQELIARWEQSAKINKPVDVHADMGRLAIRIIDQTIFGMNFGPEINQMRNALNVIYREMYWRMTHIFNVPFFVPTDRNREFNKSLHLMHHLADRIIKKHTASDKDSFVTRITNIGEKIPGLLNSPQSKIDAVLSYLVPGHESTANTLSWACYQMSLNPEIEKKNFEELNKVLKGAELTFQNLQELKYIDQIIMETLRMYPPVWNNSRVAIKKDEIGGYPIVPGTTVIICPYALHRNPQFWQNPEQFNPQRFEPDKLKTINPYVYLPFGVGPRKCIGAGFAILEIKLALAMITQKFRMKLLNKEDVKVRTLISLPPQDPIVMEFIPR